MADELRDPRAVLLKPGDLLILGNVGPMDREVVGRLHEFMTELKDAIGFAGVVIFEQDVSIDSIEERAFKLAMGKAIEEDDRG